MKIFSKRQLAVGCALMFAAFGVFAQTPISMNGQLKLVGNQLSNACGDPVQLRGISTHTPMGHQNCYTQSSIEVIANDWKADVLRLAMYTDVSEGTDYLDDPAGWDVWIDAMVNFAEDYGMYVIIDWHILEDNDPMSHVNEAKTFFANMSNKYKNKDHVIYEICNEPNGWVDWNRIREYANEVIPVIRANDSENIILVGTPQWSSRPGDVFSNPLSGSNAYNVMYTYHFYAGSHYDYDYLKNVLGSLPVFVSEWGTTAASGNWGYNEGGSNTWLDILDGNNNGGVTVSSCNWTFSDKDETSAALTSGSCETNNWTSRTTSGNFVRNYLREADNFTQCSALADDDNDGVLNKDDQCPNTPPGDNVNSIGCTAPLEDNDNDGISDTDDECPGTPANTTVNLYGCEIVHDFVNNSCFGVNNFQGYARDDFEQDFYMNMFWWAINDPNDVYDATVTNGELVVDVTNADPNFSTFGMSFGEDGNSELVTIDISHHPTFSMDVEFNATGSYASSTVLVDIQIEDADGNALSTDALKNLHRKVVSLNSPTTITANFENGFRESYDAGECGSNPTPCYFSDFDFSKLTKVIMWVNPGAGESWSRPEFTGTWTIDNFSIGYDALDTEPCDPFRDDDGDGVAIEFDKCGETPSNETANIDGCSQSQLDDDEDEVSNVLDACPNTPTGEVVDASGCADSQLDDDVDGVNNPDDECDDTPESELADENGCSESQKDDDNDGVMNDKDLCADTPNGAVVDANGCTLVATNALSETGISIYPLPASSRLVIEQLVMKFSTAQIVDLSGRVLLTETLSSAQQQLNVDQLEPGTYILNLNGANQQGAVTIIIE